MSHIIATVVEINKCESLHVLKFSAHGEFLSMMSLDIDDDIDVGTKVSLHVKPSHIAVAKNFTGMLSYSNQLPCTIVALENGELLSSIKLRFFDGMLESIITLASSKKMHLEVGDEVIALIKASELSIGEIIDA